MNYLKNKIMQLDESVVGNVLKSGVRMVGKGARGYGRAWKGGAKMLGQADPATIIGNKVIDKIPGVKKVLPNLGGRGLVHGATAIGGAGLLAKVSDDEIKHRRNVFNSFHNNDVDSKLQDALDYKVANKEATALKLQTLLKQLEKENYSVEELMKDPRFAHLFTKQELEKYF